MNKQHVFELKQPFVLEKRLKQVSNYPLTWRLFSFPPRIFQQVSGGQSIHTPQQLMEGLSRIGVTCTDLAPLSSAFQLVTHRPGGHTGTPFKDGNPMKSSGFAKKRGGL